MNFVINGASGFIASQLCRYLNNAGHCGVRISRKLIEYPEEGWVCYEKDKVLNNPKKYTYLKGSVFVNLETKQPNKLQIFSKGYKDVIVDGLSDWLSWCEEVGIEKIIHFSSVKAVNPSKEHVHEDENTPSNSKYGNNKWQAEKLIHEWALKRPSVKTATLRVSPVYGKNCKGNIRRLVALTPTGIGVPANLFKYRVSLVSILNLVAATEHIANNLCKGNQKYNITNKEELNLHDLIKIVSNAKIDVGKEITNRLVFTTISQLLKVKPISALINSISSKFIKSAYFSPQKLINSGFCHPETTRFSLMEYCRNFK